ncbi:PAS domain S-box protein [Nostoc sp. UHCC 0870]|uniref:PAS domain S-box protein n=1 Tax=Nostoc sp. UHCC 0870 TaxID=2914041 RepID=UPI001EDEB469|nr:PAS domain S-box protein [Nostoc sp. UHCC 0870]UKO96251.1 PAS domain S-box protein [Nostoc sp. UHCC 0870]
MSEAISQMDEGGTGIVVVADSQVVGWLSAQQLVKLMALGVDCTTTKISAVMQQHTAMTIKPCQLLNIATVLSRLHQYQSSCLLVIDEQGKLIGTVTAESILQSLEIPADSSTPESVVGNVSEAIFKTEASTLNEFWGQQSIDVNEENTAKLKLALETTKTIYWERNLTNNQIYFLNNVVVGSEPEAKGTVYWDEVMTLVHPDDREIVELANQSAIANLGSFEIEHRLLISGQTSAYKRVLARGTVLRDRIGRPTRMIGVTMDIDHRLEAQASLTQANQELEMQLAERAIALQQKNEQLLAEQTALATSEERFRFLAESIPQQVWITRADGYCEYVNQRTLDYFGTTPEQILGWQWEKFVHPDDQERCLAAWSHSLATGANYEIELRLLSADAITYRWHLGRALPLRDHEGNIVNWFGTNTDIHDLVTAKVSLRESESRYQTIAKISPVGIFRTDVSGNCIYVNQCWCEIAQMTPQEAAGQGWVRAIHPADQEHVWQQWYEAVANNQVFRSEYRFQRPDGSYRWVIGQAVAEKEETGNILSYVGTITDISDHKRTEEALAERVRLADFRGEVDTILTQSSTLQEMMRHCTEALVKNLDAAFARIWLLNPQNNVLELQVSSGIYTHIDGQHRSVPLGQFKIGLIAQAGQPYLTNSVQDDPRISNKEWAKQESMVAFAGYPLIVEGETLGVIALFSRQILRESTFTALGIAAHEIAIGIKRKQAEVALQESEERFRNLVETSSDWVWEVDENIIYTYVSPKIRDILGYEPQELLGKSPLELLPPEELERVLSIFEPIAAAQQPFKCLENINLHKDGHLVTLETSGVPIFNAEGKFCGYRGIDRDVTARKQAESKLREIQARLQAILDNSPAVIYLIDTQNRFVLVNHQYEKLFHTTQDEIVGKSIYDVWPRHVADGFAVNNHLVIAGGNPIEVEEIVPQEDGLYTYISVKFPLKDSNGVSYAVCGISTDITDRKRAEEELRQSEEYFRLLVESIKDYAIYMLDPQGQVMSWNSGAECITGYQTPEIVGRHFSCFFPPEEIAQDIPQQQLEMAAAQGRCECESIFVRKDGSNFWANCILTALRDASGNLRGFSKVTRDITDRKLAEESLLRFQKAIESTSDAVVITDVRGVSIYVNPAFVGLYGYNLEQLEAAGGTWVISQQPQDSQQILTAIHRGQSWRGEVTMRSRTGQILQVDLRIDAIKDTKGKIFGTVCIHTDITKRQQVEEGLRLRDRAIAASSNGIIIADASIPNGPIIYVNPAFERITGYSYEEVIGQNFRLFHSAEINQPGLQELNAAMQTGKAGTVILRDYRKDGSLFWSELNISPVYDHTDKLTHYIGIQTDITERQQAETALLISQQRLQYLLTSSPAIIYACKTSGDFGALFISENVSTLLGYEAAQITEDSSFWISRIHPEDIPQVVANLANVLQQGHYKLEYRFLHQDGTYRWLYDKGKVVRDDIGNPVELVGYRADITDRKQLEEELKVGLEKEKELSELKSRFVSMTSHEFRTPLSIILSSSELLEHYHHKLTPEKQLTHLNRIQTAVKRMTEMLDDVLIIGKAEAGKLEFVPQSFDLVAYCRHLVEETQVHFSNYQIDFTSEKESIECCMDDKLLGHILSNLLSNAIKYSPANSHIKFMLKTLNGQAIFEIQDEGIGIPPEDIPHLFESFHRASNVGNILGTGLGLAIVKKCVDIYKGEIFVKSILGVGTVFTVNLPLNNQI